MEPSPVGILLVLAIAWAGYAFGATLLAGLFIAIPFGASAIGVIPALGGSSPQVFTVFAAALILVTFLQPGSLQDAYRFFRQHWVAPVAAALLVIAAVGAIALPRVFAGQTSAFIILAGRIFEAPLSPVSGNISQTLYFVLGILVFFSLSIMLCRDRQWSVVRFALLAFAATNGLLGLADIVGKLAGQSDILDPIRTASYAFLTATEERSFWRIAGAQSEASAFAQSSLASLGVAFGYWRATGSLAALAIAALNAVLLVFSTSSTAYVAIAVIAVVAVLYLLSSLIAGNVAVRDVHAMLMLSLVVLFVIVLAAVASKSVETFVDMLDKMVLKKASSESGSERAYWNLQSLAAFSATSGIGIGMGSSRASSWLVAVISQLGLPGIVALSALTYSLCRDAARVEAQARESVVPVEYTGLAAASRSGALASLLGASISGAGADPGILFFLCLAIVTALAVTELPSPRTKQGLSFQLRRMIVRQAGDA